MQTVANCSHLFCFVSQFRYKTRLYMQRQRQHFINTYGHFRHIDNVWHANKSVSFNVTVCTCCLSLAMHFHSVTALPASMTRATNRLAVAVTFAKATRLARRWSKATHLAVLHHRLAQPLNLWVVADGRMERIHTDHLKVLVRRVVSNPVAVQHPQSFALAANTFLFTHNVYITIQLY